mgnify:CR=1 FL=1
MKVQTKRTSRISAVLLALVMLLSLVPTTVFAADAGDDATTYVLAGGDFQEGDWDADGDGRVTQHEASAQNVSNILAQVSQHYPTMDGFLFTGDYDGDTHGENRQDILDGMNSLMNSVQATYPNLNANNSVLVQGNHDPANTGFDATGGQDFAAYSVYVIDEDDYPDRGGSQSAVQAVANNLRTWLAAREDSSKPIFVITHLPLAYGTRTYQNGDGKYAKYLFDVLNEAGANGQNIFFLHGHDHAYGCDNPLGGEAIYLPKGDTIRIANVGSQTQYQEYTLNFTYMNAGYVGYYNESGYTINERDDHKLTMTVFAIAGNQVTVERYNAYGIYNLKSAGRDGYYSSTSSSASRIGLPINQTVYASPQTVALTQVAQEQTFTDSTGISVTAKSGTELVVNTLPNTTVYNNIDSYQLYNIAVTDYDSSRNATVSIPVPAAYNAEQVYVYRVNGTALENVNAVIENGMATFGTNSFGSFMVAQLSADALRWEEVTIPGETHYNYTLDTNGVDNGGHYLIVAPTTDVALADNGSGSGYSSVLQKPVMINGNTATVDADTYALADWTIGANGTVEGPAVTTGTTNTYNATTVTASGKNYTLANPSNYYYATSDGQYYRVTSATCARGGNFFRYTYTWTIRYEGGSKTASTQSITLYTVTSASTTAPSTYDAWYLKANRGMYLKIGTGASGDFAYDSAASKIVINPNGSTGQYQLIRYYSSSINADLMYNGGWATDKVSNGSNYAHPTSHYVRLYKYTGTETIVGEHYYLTMVGDTDFTFAAGEFANQAALEQYLRNAITVYRSDDARDDNKSAVAYDIVGTVNPAVPGSSTLNINCGGKSWPVTVTFTGKTVTSVTVDRSGSVRVKASNSTATGSTMIIAYSDGSRDTVSVKLNMVSGNFNVKKRGTYRNLTVSYDGYTVSGYTLVVS